MRIDVVVSMGPVLGCSGVLHFDPVIKCMFK